MTSQIISIFYWLSRNEVSDINVLCLEMLDFKEGLARCCVI